MDIPPEKKKIEWIYFILFFLLSWIDSAIQIWLLFCLHFATRMHGVRSTPDMSLNALPMASDLCFPWSGSVGLRVYQKERKRKRKINGYGYG